MKTRPAMKNRTLNVFIFAVTLVTLLLGTSCSSPQKLLETGNYDNAVTASLRKLSGKKKKKTKHVQALEAAFAKATARDMERAEQLKSENRPENWEQVYEIYRRIERRQNKVEPMLPLVDEDGIKANFRFVRVDGLINESKENSAAYLYSRALELIENAREGDKLAARKAYNELEKIDRFYQNYKDKGDLKSIARELGTTHILLEAKNVAPVYLPSNMEDEISQISLRGLDSFWKKYHSTGSTQQNFDYKVIVKITNVDVTPGLVKEREYEDAKEIEEGFEYVLDQNGNVMKDSLGNDIKVPKKVTIRARVVETYQSKIAQLTSRIEVLDLQSNNLVETKNITVDAIFDNYASTFYGDKRALSSTSKRRIGNQPVPFPSDEALLFDAAQKLRPIIKDRLSQTRVFI